MFHDASTSLFLGDLSVYCTEKDIFQLFQPFGPIESIQLKRKSTSNGRPSYGFVQFRFRESAEEALRVMNGKVVHGRAIRLGWAEPPKVNVKVTAKPPQPRQSASTEFLERGLNIDTAQVHFSYVTSRTAPLKEDIFRNVFQHFGPVLDVAIKKSQYQQDKGVQTGYGFIHYPLTEEGINSAMEAVRSLHELVLDSVKYSCRVSHALEEYMKLRSLGGTLPPSLSNLPNSNPMSSLSSGLPGSLSGSSPFPSSMGGIPPNGAPGSFPGFFGSYENPVLGGFNQSFMPSSMPPQQAQLGFMPQNSAPPRDLHSIVFAPPGVPAVQSFPPPPNLGNNIEEQREEQPQQAANLFGSKPLDPNSIPYF